MATQEVKHKYNANADVYGNNSSGFRIKCTMTSPSLLSSDTPSLSPSDTSSLSPSGPTGGAIKQQCRMDTSVKPEYDCGVKLLSSRFITAVCMILLTSTMALAADTTTETCANGAGRVITGAVTGHKYCRSNGGMNWWNAVSWCDALGTRLFDRPDCACGNITADCANSKCPELTAVGNVWIWMRKAMNESRAYMVRTDDGYLSNSNHLGHSFATYALCY